MWWHFFAIELQACECNDGGQAYVMQYIYKLSTWVHVQFKENK